MFNIDPKIWGHSAWEFLFYVALSYSNNPSIEEQNNMKNFFLATGKILPCQKCRINFSNHLKKFPLNDYVLSNRDNLINWLVTINNEVRTLNGTNKLTANEILSRYVGEKTNGIDYKTSLICVLSLLIIICILIFFVKFRY